MKFTSYRWFVKKRGNIYRDTMLAALAMYFIGWGAYALAVFSFSLGYFLQAFYMLILGIFLHTMFTVFDRQLWNTILSDKLDRIYYRTPGNFERKMK